MLSAFLGARPHQRAYPNHACVRPPGHQRKQGREREITRDEPRVSSSIVGTSRDPRFARLRAVLDPAHLLGPLSLSTPGSVLMSVEEVGLISVSCCADPPRLLHARGPILQGSR